MENFDIKHFEKLARKSESTPFVVPQVNAEKKDDEYDEYVDTYYISSVAPKKGGGSSWMPQFLTIILVLLVIYWIYVMLAPVTYDDDKCL